LESDRRDCRQKCQGILNCFAAAVEAGVRVALLEPLAAAPDQPVAITHPQGEYLKGWLAMVRGAVV
jgi:hypothetical protein